jgi:hypothetical protein
MAGNRSFSEYVTLVAGAVRGLSADQIQEAAALSFASQYGDGPHLPVWHAASIITGNIDKCQCWPCCKARQEQKAA